MVWFTLKARVGGSFGVSGWKIQVYIAIIEGVRIKSRSSPLQVKL